MVACRALLEWAGGKRGIIVREACGEASRLRLTPRRAYDVIGILRGLGFLEKRRRGVYDWTAGWWHYSTERGGGDLEEHLARTVRECDVKCTMGRMTRLFLRLFMAEDGSFPKDRVVQPKASLTDVPEWTRRGYDVCNILGSLGIIVQQRDPSGRRKGGFVWGLGRRESGAIDAVYRNYFSFVRWLSSLYRTAENGLLLAKAPSRLNSLLRTADRCRARL